MDVKHLCLGVLTIKDATGYDIKKFFEHAFKHFFVAGYGSIYPALADLHKNGLVQCEEMAQEKLPDKKVYRITEAGREAFLNSLMATEPRHKVRSEFLVLMYFAHMLPPEHLATLVSRRLNEIEKTLEGVEEYVGQSFPGFPGIEFTTGFGQALLSAAKDYMREQGPKLISSVEQLEHVDAEVQKAS